MDIREYIADYMLSKTSDSHPALVAYDPERRYQPLLPLFEARGATVVDTTCQPLHAYEQAMEAWKEVTADNTRRVVIYRASAEPANAKQQAAEPYLMFALAGKVFPQGPNDAFVNICQRFLPSKTEEIARLEQQGNISFDTVNTLQDGAAYPTLETLTSGHSPQEITIGLLTLTDVDNFDWVGEWRRLAEAHFPGMDATGMTLADIKNATWRYLLFSEFVLDLPTALPQSLSTVGRAPESERNTIFQLCCAIRNRIDLRDDYVEHSRRVTSQLQLDRLFASATDLGQVVTFAFENRVEYDRFVQAIENHEYHQASQLALDARHGIWFSADPEVECFWKIAEQASILFQCIGGGIPTLESLEDLTRWYTTVGYKVDNALRGYLHIVRQNDYAIPQLERLNKLVYAAYRTMTERTQHLYQDFCAATNWNDIAIAHNNEAFCTYIDTALAQGHRVVMVMADAFRYEMGMDFTHRIADRFPEVSCWPALAVMPPVTRFGMAALLPKAKDATVLKEVDGKLQPFLDGKQITLPDDRIAYIRQNVTVNVADATIENYRSLTLSNDVHLLVVRSTQIDSAGESCAGGGLATMETEMRSLANLMEWCRQKDFDMAFIFADHGYMLQPDFRSGDKVEKPLGNDIALSERRCLAGNLNDSQGSLTFTPDQLGVKCNVHCFSFAKGYSVYENGVTYFHEGLSMQENIVPIVKVTLKKEEEKSASVSLRYKGKETGIVRILRPTLDINVTASQLFAEPMNAKMLIRSAAGNMVAHPVASDNYNEMTDILTLPANGNTIKQAIEIQDGVSGDISVCLLDPTTGATLASIILHTDFDF